MNRSTARLTTTLILTAQIVLAQASTTVQHNPFAMLEQHENTAPNIQHFAIKHRHATDIKKMITAMRTALLGEKSHVVADNVSNGVWIVGKVTNPTKLKQLITETDREKTQINIHVKIITIDTMAMQQLGLRIQSLSSKEVSQRHTMTDLENTQKHWQPIQSILRNIDAMIHHGYGAVIASPTLRMADKEESMIESGEEVPYYERSKDGDTSTTFKSATLKLTLHPRLIDKQRLSLRIQLQQDKISDLSVGGIPAIRTQKIHSAIQIKNHQTIVLGGMFTHRIERADTRIPILSSIPIIGKLFTHQRWLWQRQELLVIVTPDWHSQQKN